MNCQVTTQVPFIVFIFFTTCTGAFIEVCMSSLHGSITENFLELVQCKESDMELGRPFEAITLVKPVGDVKISSTVM